MNDVGIAERAVETAVEICGKPDVARIARDALQADLAARSRRRGSG